MKFFQKHCVKDCIPGPTRSEKYWEYDEYYLGEKDSDERRQGQGGNYWSGAKSLESYNGQLVRDTMHGVGTYRWKFYGPEGTFYTYEGHFYANRKHGYGLLSYPDGRVFEGLFYNDVRWGPGVETHINLNQDVGLWCNNKLIRLSWRPPGPSVIPDFLSVANGRLAVNKFRTVFRKKVEIIGEVNSALELLKQSGCEPQVAAEKWHKLYPKHCNDFASQLCHVDFFDKTYYKKCKILLEKSAGEPLPLSEQGEDVTRDSKSTELETDISTYAWNNNDIIVHMMEYSYQQDNQRKRTRINIKNILSGPRTRFHRAGKYENDCRNLLMGSYLGRVGDVTRLILDQNVHPDLSDVQGNSAIMYAACGDQPRIIHFLVESGGNVDGVNDSCCTPLSIALTRFLCVQTDVSTKKILDAVIPLPDETRLSAADWQINREIFESKSELITKVGMALRKSKSKATQMPSGSQNSKKDKNEDDEDTNDAGQNIENKIKTEFAVKANELYADKQTINTVEYLFQVHDIVNEIDFVEEETKKNADKPQAKKAISKVVHETKPSKDHMYQEDLEECKSIDSANKIKKETLQQIQSTISQLLSDGADPKLVKFPQPALFMATIAGSTELITQLIEFGADVNEHYPDVYNYTPLDIAVSQKFTMDSIEVIRALLDQGADASHRLELKLQGSLLFDGSNTDAVLGPTLLHSVVLRKLEFDYDEEKRLEVINLLLQYHCDPLVQYKGISVIELCMTRCKELFNTIIRHPNTDLNGVINSSNQSVLVKMFTPLYFKSLGSERSQMLTNLLLYGADPLRQCQNETETYENLFAFAKETLQTLKNTKSSAGVSPVESRMGIESKKPKKDDKKAKADKLKVVAKGTDDVTDYREALELVAGCARILHIRWLQAKLFKELTEVVYVYKHRVWNMIIKEHKHKIGLNIWVTVQRGLEIWDLLSIAKHKIYNDNIVLKYTLYIIHFYEIAQTLYKLRTPFMTASEKAEVESYVNKLLREYKQQKHSSNASLKVYVMPELAPKNDKKFNVCFECALPLKESMIACKKCKLVFFCSKECIKINFGNVNAHPCNAYLKSIYGMMDEANPDSTVALGSKSSPTMDPNAYNSSNPITANNI